MNAASHISTEKILPPLEKALHSRRDMLSQPHHSAVRLFNGFLEGFPRLVVDVFGHTLVIQSFFKPHEIFAKTVPTVWNFYISRLDWLNAVLLKIRHTEDAEARNGTLLYGNAADDRIRENGVWYALDLQMNQDTGLYLDTRNLRKWLIDKMNDKSVLNLFAYTGSLGVAACAGGARRVVQVDRNRKFLNLAHASYTLNGFKISHADSVGMDFWMFTARMRRAKALFDCVLLDPPFFSSTSQGNLQLEHHTRRLVNKVRPLVSHDGYLIVINNALYLSGQEYYRELEELGSDGHLALEEIISVPADITGDENTRLGKPPVDPAPFNHSTKIAILRAHRKDRLTSRDVPPPTIRG